MRTTACYARHSQKQNLTLMNSIKTQFKYELFRAATKAATTIIYHIWHCFLQSTKQVRNQISRLCVQMTVTSLCSGQSHAVSSFNSHTSASFCASSWPPSVPVAVSVSIALALRRSASVIVMGCRGKNPAIPVETESGERKTTSFTTSSSNKHHSTQPRDAALFLKAHTSKLLS